MHMIGQVCALYCPSLQLYARIKYKYDVNMSEENAKQQQQQQQHCLHVCIYNTYAHMQYILVSVLHEPKNYVQTIPSSRAKRTSGKIHFFLIGGTNKTKQPNKALKLVDVFKVDCKTSLGLGEFGLSSSLHFFPLVISIRF